MEKRRMCPHCRAFITTDDKVCPYCDAPVGARAIDVRMPTDLLGGLIPSARFLSVLLLVINSGLYVATIVYSMKSGNRSALTDIDGRTLMMFGAKWPVAIAAGQYWRLVTAGFLHGGLFHFGMNTWVLLDLGPRVEEAFGASRMAVIYFVATVMGFLASVYWSPALSIGASAGIFGLIGAMIAYGAQHRTMMGQMIKSHYSRWAVYGLLLGFLPGFNIDNAAHLGGLAGGFAIASIAGTPSLRPSVETLWNWIAYGCVALTAASFAKMGAEFIRLSSAMGN